MILLRNGSIARIATHVFGERSSSSRAMKTYGPAVIRRRRTAARIAAAIETTLRTYVFADLRDYTAFVEGAGDRAAADLIRSYRQVIRERLEPHRGAEVKTEGDSFYIVFASPSQAIEFGVDVFRASESRRDLRFGIGIHAGETVPFDDQFVGSAVNLAARVGAIAGEGELLVTETVRGLVRTSCPYVLLDRGAVSLKGVPEPVRLYAVDWRARAVTPRPVRPALAVPPPRPSLVGRREELSRLDRRGADLRELLGATVLIGGTAGIGKTRLVTDWSAATAIFTLTGRCGATDARPAYEPFVEMLRSVSRAAAEEARLRATAPELLSLLPELAPERPRQVDRDALFGAFLRLLREYGRDGPLVIVVEDLHWADEASLALFRFLATQAATTPYVLVGTYRNDELLRGHQLRAIIADLGRRADAHLMVLGALDERGSGELLARTASARELSDEERRRVVELAEGNPLFLEELARTAADPGQALPLTIADAVLRRVAELDDTSRRLVTYAAVGGQQVSFELLARLLAQSERDLLRAARAAVERSILVETADGLAFRHALTREAVYRDLMRREQRLLHEEVADAVAAVHGSDPAFAHEIERQLVDAGRADRALPYALAAGEHALRLLAPATAVLHFERAIDAAGPRSLERARALEGLGNAYRLELQVGKAVATLRDATSLMAEVGSPADRLRVQRALARALPYGKEERDAHRAAWDLAQGVATDAELAIIANTLADRAFQFIEEDDARHWVGGARAHAVKAGSQGITATVERTAREVEHPPGWHAAEERELARGLDRALERDEGVLLAYRRYLDSRCRDASAEERDALLGRARSYADRQTPGVARAIVFRYGPAWISWLDGGWDDVTAFWVELQRRFAGEDLAEIFPDTGPVAASVRSEREGPDAVGAELTALAERQATTATWRGRLAAACHLANVQLAVGRPDEVRGRLGAIVAQRTPQAFDVPTFLLAARVTLPAALILGDREVLRPWSEATPLLANEGAIFDAVYAHAAAVDAALDGDRGSAIERYRRAADLYRDRGWDHLAAELAWQRARCGDESELERAHKFYAERGASWRTRWLEEGRWR